MWFAFLNSGLYHEKKSSSCISRAFMLGPWNEKHIEETWTWPGVWDTVASFNLQTSEWEINVCSYKGTEVLVLIQYFEKHHNQYNTCILWTAMQSIKRMRQINSWPYSNTSSIALGTYRYPILSLTALCPFLPLFLHLYAIVDDDDNNNNRIYIYIYGIYHELLTLYPSNSYNLKLQMLFPSSLQMHNWDRE